MRQRPQPNKKSLKNEYYENEISCYCGRADRRGNIVCASGSLCIHSPAATAVAGSRGEASGPGSCGAARRLCAGHTCGGGRTAMPGTGICLDGRILGRGPCLGGRLLASGTACGRLCPSLLRTSLWVAPLVIKDVVPPALVFTGFSGAGKGGTRKHGRARATCALLFGKKLF